MPYVDLVCRALLGSVFALAVLGKFRHKATFAAFTGSLSRLDWLPAGSRRTAAASVVALEGTSVVLLALPATSGAGAALAGGTMIVFSGVAWRQRRVARPLRCHCFGSDGGDIGPVQLARNGLLLLVAITDLAAHAGTGRVTAGGAWLAVASGALAGLLVARWDDLAFLFSAAPRGHG
jgi:hypothetical protein